MGDPDHAPAGRRRWRTVLVAAAVMASLVGASAVAYRVLGPAEVTSGATGDYPVEAPTARPGVIGTLAAAPLIVDGRVRVYAAKRQLRADAPVDARTQRSPLWSYRRWPEQLVGVVAAGTTVVGRWSDGTLVAIDARTGQVRWRADGPGPEVAEYTGRRTGAATVYAPEGLFIGGDVVVVRSDVDLDTAGVVGVDLASGRRLWRLTTVPFGCRRADFTTVSGRYAVVDQCTGGREREVRFYDVRTGELDLAWRLPAGAAGKILSGAPLGCRVGRSDCAAMLIDIGGRGLGWLLRGPTPVPAPGLDTESPGANVTRPRSPTSPATGGGIPLPVLVPTPDVGDVAVQGMPSRLTGARAADGRQLWTWQPAGSKPENWAWVVAAEPGRVHLLTYDYWLVTVDTATGAELSRFLFTYGRERTGWEDGLGYASGGFVTVERLAAGAGPRQPDDEYYFVAQPVLFAGT